MTGQIVRQNEVHRKKSITWVISPKESKRRTKESSSFRTLNRALMALGTIILKRRPEDRHGLQYNAEGEKQISEYLDCFGLPTGYMLSFNFNKNKKTDMNQVHIGDKLLYEVVV